MLIGFVGSHGTGKTSVAEEFSKMTGAIPLTSSSRNVHDAGLPINQEATRLTQLMITVSRANQAHKAKNSSQFLPVDPLYVSDRTPLDSYAYTSYQVDNVWDSQPALDKLYLEETLSLVTGALPCYDMLFYFPIYWRVKADEARKDDITYQAIIDDRITSLLSRMEINTIEMPNVTVTERVHFIKAHLDMV